uniref:TNF receptor-associated factor n=1 Tax=Eptatretus burgeri TaxID=7764 RepID=A0A8C4NP17_EPTBU
MTAETSSMSSEKPGGYPLNLLVGSPDPKNLCMKCDLLLKKPVQARCGHRFCSACLLQLVRDGPTRCSKCVEENSFEEDISILQPDGFFPDRAAKREIEGLPAKCINTGCSWSGVVRNYEEHIIICPKLLVVCEECMKQMPRDQLVQHVKQCSKKRSTCRFAFLGCTEKVEGNIVEHEQKSFVNHLGLVLDVLHKTSGVTPVPPGTLEARISFIEQKLVVVEQMVSLRTVTEPHLGASCGKESHLSQKRTTGVTDKESSTAGEHLGALRQRLELAEQSIHRFEDVVTVLNREVQSVAVQRIGGDQVQHGNIGTIDFLNSKIRTFEQEVGVNGVALADLRKKVEAMEMATFDGIFIWKITEVSRKRSDAISGRQIAHYSPAFYTSRYGFRLCLRIYLNGDGAGRGTHISLFFVIMKGEHDALIRWPFRQKVTLMLMDQNNREHVIDAFRPDQTSSSFQRPVNELNVASGCPLFCSLATLDASRNSYVRDDTLFIKCIVDTSDL